MKKLMTKKELADYLKVSTNTINLWIIQKRVPYLKLGPSSNSLVRFSLEEIENWMKTSGFRSQGK